MKTALAALALLSATAVSRLVGQGDDESTRKTLTGLHGVRVVVLMSDIDETRNTGLSPQLLTDVEVKVRQAGITVLSQQEAPSGPLLVVYVHVKNVSPPTYPVGFYALCLTVELHQWVKLTRNPSLTVWVSTWSATEHLGTASDLSSGRDEIRDMTDEFINAYLAANPKR